MKFYIAIRLQHHYVKNTDQDIKRERKDKQSG